MKDRVKLLSSVWLSLMFFPMFIIALADNIKGCEEPVEEKITDLGNDFDLLKFNAGWVGIYL